MYAALDLAKYIVNKCIADEHPISNLKLQSILFCVQKEYLKNNDIAFPENFEAMGFGPAIPDVYYHFCGFGAIEISHVNFSIDINPKDAKVINRVVEEKRGLAPWDIAKNTIAPGGAWEQVYSSGKKERFCPEIIPLELIKEEAIGSKVSLDTLIKGAECQKKDITSADKCYKDMNRAETEQVR